MGPVVCRVGSVLWGLRLLYRWYTTGSAIIIGSAEQITAECRAKLRTLYHGHKDANNPELRRQALSAALSPAQLACPSSAELVLQKES
jgi:hypothetical protein